MKTNVIPEIRISNQKISGSEFRTAGELLSYMGAIQAQDYIMAKWAIGLRLRGAADHKIEHSLNTGEIIRTHVMRPTWHFVPAADIYWMLELTAPQIRSAIKTRHKHLGFTEDLLKKSNRIIGKALSDGGSLTRQDFAREFEKAGIRTDGNRLAHLMVCAELDGIVCSGPVKNDKQTFTLLQKRVPYKKVLTREESLAELAKRYFSSHGPATARDFAWWSGLNLTDARKAMNLVKPDFISETIGSENYLFPEPHSTRMPGNTMVNLLPAYDEFLIGYSDRSAALTLANFKKTVSTNGIFRPVIVVNGQIAGIWKRSMMKDKIILVCHLFRALNKLTRDMIRDEAKKYGLFLNMKVEVTFKTD